LSHSERAHEANTTPACLPLAASMSSFVSASGHLVHFVCHRSSTSGLPARSSLMVQLLDVPFSMSRMARVCVSSNAGILARKIAKE
jgi:hypothetical protein